MPVIPLLPCFDRFLVISIFERKKGGGCRRGNLFLLRYAHFMGPILNLEQHKPSEHYTLLRKQTRLWECPISILQYSFLSVCLTENHAKSKKNVTKLISVRKKSYSFSKYLMPIILKYIIHISYIFSFFL